MNSTTLRQGALAICRCLLCLVPLCLPATTSAQAPQVEGLFVTVRALDSDEMERIRTITREAVERFQAADKGRPDGAQRLFKIVFDFNPEGAPTSSANYGACYDLAEHFLTTLRRNNVVTIAFVRNSVTRHSVLPVLACQDLVMASGAKLGDVPADTKLKRAFYVEVLRQRLGRSWAVGLRMLDKDLKVQEVAEVQKDAENVPFFVDATLVTKGEVNAQTGLIKIRLDEADVTVRKVRPEAVSPAEPGTLLFTAERAKAFGLSSDVLETRQDVMRKYQMPPISLREDPLLGRNPSAWRIEIRGALTTANVESLKRRIRRAIASEANLLFLHLEDCGGGDFQAALDLAEMLRTLKDDQGERPVATVAYIPRDAPDTAAIVALGCTQIVMHKDATIGDFSRLPEKDAVRNSLRIKALEGLARSQGYPEALAAGMLNNNLAVHRAVNQQGQQFEWRLVTDEQLRELNRNGIKWQVQETVARDPERGNALVLRAEKARDYQLVRDVVEGDPRQLEDVYRLFGLKANQVRAARGDWLDSTAEFFRKMWVGVLLVMVGIICLIMELKLPGFGLPGIMAALCFILFFWAHSMLAGQFTWLAVLLFLLALGLIGVEIFVLPGFGVCGISGVLLLLTSLALVTLERKPETTSEWLDFGATLSAFGGSMLGAIVGAAVLAYYLPSIPYVNRLVLKPEGDGGELSGESSLESIRPELVALLGAIGVAATPLRPAGKVQFGEEFVDVVAEGGYVVPGSRVQVVEIEGNRVVVKEV